MAQKFADDYVTVAERVTAFYERYPEGSIQATVLELSDSRVTIRAEAFRTPDDPRPGVGHASMAIPGSTPFTRGSELENTESSAWGRALAALGFETKRGIASADEVRAKGGTLADRGVQPPPPAPAAQAHRAPEGKPGVLPEVLSLGEALDLLRAANIPTKAISAKGRELYGQWQLKELTPEQRAHVVEELLRDQNAPVPPAGEEDAASFDEGDL